MTTAPLDKYIKSPPPADERSHFNYLEEQFNKLENVSNKHVVRIGENDATAKALVLQEANARVDGDAAQATYTQTVAAQTLASATALVNTETTARTTADSALASQITTINTTLGTLSGNITSEASIRLTADEALGTRIDNLVLTSGNDAAVIIDEEASARIAADYALGVRIDSLTTTVNSNTAAVSTEQTARSTRDDALAKQLFTMSSGSARVYISTTAPSSTGRQAGDVWFDSSTNNYKPYVWAQVGGTGSYDWRDNSDGSYTNKVGNYAVYTQNISTLTNTTSSLTSSVTALQSTVGDSSAGLVKDVSALTTTVGNSSSGLVKDVTTLQSTTAQQRIFRQSTQPSTATADRKVGDIWFDTSNGNTPYYWNGSAWVLTTDTTRASQASLTTEQQARTTADTALASYLMSASAGTSRVYTSDPGTTGRQNGDVWIKPEENFKQYVWYNSAWNDNSTGAYSQYIGILANVSSTSAAAYTTADNAQTAASNATTIAQQAKDTATSANTAAGTAVSTADSANNIANLAQNIANGAKDTANAAKSTADGAKDTANAAAYKADQVSASVGSPTDPTSANTVYGKINNVSAVVATNNTALAARINSVEVSVGSPSDATSANTAYGKINNNTQAIGTPNDAAGVSTVYGRIKSVETAAATSNGVTASRVDSVVASLGTSSDTESAGTAFGVANGARSTANGAVSSIGNVNDPASANTVYGKINQTNASITTEQTARVNADSAIARYVTTAAAGTGRVFTQDTAPTSAQSGDVWFKTNENFKPYVYYSSAWNDNSTGSYTQYVGQIASVTTTATAAYNNAGTAQTAANNAQSTANSALTMANNVGYEWRVQGTIDGQPAGSIKLAGAKKYNADGTTSTASKLVIDADCDINGNLVVNGTISTGKIANNAVSNSATVTVGTGSTTATVNIPVRAGSRVAVIATFNSKRFFTAAQFPPATLTLSRNGTEVTRGECYNYYYGFNTQVGLYDWFLGGICIAYSYVASADGTDQLTAYFGSGGPMTLVAWELAR